MNEALQLSLANNAKEWLALSSSISSAEKGAFNALHNGFFASYGPNFMAHVYRSAIEQLMQSLPATEREKLLSALEQGITEAIAKHAYSVPTAADCLSCHARKF
jgi:hypothetical protein